MSNKQIEDVYYTLIGVMNEAYCVEGVENLFAGESECACAYSRMLGAYGRLRDRLGVENEDTDVETIISSLLDIEKTVSIKMFEYGMRFAMQEK